MREHNKESGIAILEETAPQSYYNALNDVWKMVLYHAERGAHFYKRYLNEVKAIDVHKMCTLPIITEYYNNWRDGDRNGFILEEKNIPFVFQMNKTGRLNCVLVKK